MLVCVLLIQGPISAQTAFEEGERLFIHNKPEAAVPQLRAAITQQPENQKAYLYLGVVYEQLGQYDQAIDILSRGLETPGTLSPVLHLNLGNNLFRLERYQEAELQYSSAVRLNPNLTPAILNRANTYASIQRFPEAIDDYEDYLTLRPDDPQREKIESMIELMKNLIEEERRRIAEEETRRAEEEAMRREEQKRQQELLDAVLHSLSNITEDTTNIGAGQEEIKEYEEEIDIVD
jgi:tetratricopeptide (TPR) repeat protein